MSQEGIKDEFESDASSKVGIQILLDDPKGYSVRLRNYHRKEISLAGWSIVRLTGDSHLDTKYKFPEGSKIGAKGTLTIWSRDSPGSISDPPHNLIMTDNAWHVSSNFKTVLFNNAGKEAAVRESKRVEIKRPEGVARISASRELVIQQEETYWKHRCAIF